MVSEFQFSNFAEMVSAFSTLFIALLTFVLIFENRKLRLAGLKPHVVAYLRPDATHGTMANLVIANVGSGPAFDVQYDLKINEEIANKKRVAAPLSVKDPSFGAMPQGEKIEIFFGSFIDFFEAPRLAPVKLVVSYRDTFRIIRTSEYEIDIETFAGFLVPKSNSQALLEKADKGSAALVRLANAVEATSASKRPRDAK